MRALLRFVSRKLAGFASERGTATIEFVLVFPAFMILFVSTVEVGLLMTRHAMLERGLDLAVRSVRLGTNDAVSSDELKTMICNGAGIIPDCMNEVKVEMRRVNLKNWSDVPRIPDCVDRNDPARPLAAFETGGANQMMVVRVCALFDPIFPTTGIGYHLPRKSGDAYALTALSSFVMEPT